MNEANKNSLTWPNSIFICEVGPRDGLQNEQVRLTVEQKVELINRSVEAGAKIIEVGSFVHPKAVPQMADTDEVVKCLKKGSGVEYRALVMNLRGVQRAEAAGLRKVKFTVSASRAHSMANSNCTPEEAVRNFGECAEYVTRHGMELSGSLATVFGCPFEGRVSLEQVISVITCFREIGIRELSLSDTTGMANPQQVYEYGQLVKTLFPDVTWHLHFHDIRGMGLANVVSGMLAGITHYDASFAGLGGCPFVPDAAGNIATEDLIHMCHEMGINTGYDLDQVISIGHSVQELIGHVTSSFILRAGKCSDVLLPQNKR